jgi:hypothetical protein
MKKRGRKVSIKINLTNRWLYTLIAIFVFLIAGIMVYALTPGVAPNPGHLASEMAPPTPCSSGQFLKFDGTNWICSAAVNWSDVSNKPFETKIIPIGDWNMDADEFKYGICPTTYGIDQSKIINIEVFVHGDWDDVLAQISWPLEYCGGSSAIRIRSRMYAYCSDGIMIMLSRTTGVACDSILWDRTGYNRGYVTITYEA